MSNKQGGVRVGSFNSTFNSDSYLREDKTGKE